MAPARKLDPARPVGSDPRMLDTITGLFLQNVLSPPVLFFALGLGAAAIRSDLEFPAPMTKALNLYLLFAIGFKGGSAMQHAGLSLDAVRAVVAAAVLSSVLPLGIFPLVRRALGPETGAAVAATYGSVSAVTFMAGAALLVEREVAYGGHMVAAMAVMEFPAIVVAVMLARRYGTPDGGGAGLGHLLREALTNGTVVLLIGSLLIGAATTERGIDVTRPLWSDLFQGVLCFYLLDLGLLAGRNARDLFAAGRAAIITGLLFPPCGAAAGLAAAWLAGLSRGDAFLLTTMAASGSYIAVPAAMRLVLPDARPSVYVPMALALTFPLNIALGLPLYWLVVEAAWR